MSMALETNRRDRVDYLSNIGHPGTSRCLGGLSVSGRAMPSRALRICTHAGCSALVKSGACPAHRRQQEQRRGSAAHRGYDARHREWREAIFARDKNCMICGAPGRPNDHADHIERIRDGGSRFDLANGRRLCRSCHNSLSAKQGAEDRSI